MIILLGILIMLVVLAVAGYLIYRKVTHKVRQVSRTLFQTEDLVQGIKEREMLVDNTPKSISGMEQIEAPRLLADFPELSLAELKSRNIDMVYEFYEALQQQNLGKFSDMETLNAKLQAMMQKNRADQVFISKVHVHKQAMRRYQKTAETATITFQVAYEYWQTDRFNKEGKRIQKRATTTWVYRLDEQNFGMEATASKSCPNCGAPLSGEGDLVCPYCTTTVKVDYLRTWHFTAITVE